LTNFSTVAVGNWVAVVRV